MTDTQLQFIRLITCTVSGQKLPEGFSLSDPAALFELADRQDMAHLVWYACKENKQLAFDSELSEKLQNKYYAAIWRVASLENEISKIKAALSCAEIKFVLLKGAILRSLYPKEWMRVSADIDILVEEKSLEYAEHVLAEQLKYTKTSTGPHHDHITAPNGFHVDLHFTLTEVEGAAKTILDQVWDHVEPVSGQQYEYEMEDVFFYLFHVFHMSRHFLRGGCGVRPLVDTWLLNHRIPFCKNDRYELLQQAGLKQYAEIMESVAEARFMGQPCAEHEDIEDYLFSGGVYGHEQHVAAVQAQKGNRFKYILRRFFPHIQYMRFRYPLLKRWSILLPFCWIHRLISGALNGKLKKAKHEMRQSKEATALSKEIRELFDQLGLTEL